MERSAFSDFIFVEAMVEKGYLGRPGTVPCTYLVL